MHVDDYTTTVVGLGANRVILDAWVAYIRHGPLSHRKHHLRHSRCCCLAVSPCLPCGSVRREACQARGPERVWGKPLFRPECPSVPFVASRFPDQGVGLNSSASFTQNRKRHRGIAPKSMMVVVKRGIIALCRDWQRTGGGKCREAVVSLWSPCGRSAWGAHL